MPTRTGAYVRFGRERNERATLLHRQDGAQVPTCGLTCGGMVPSLVMRDWNFDHV